MGVNVHSSQSYKIQLRIGIIKANKKRLHPPINGVKPFSNIYSDSTESEFQINYPGMGLSYDNLNRILAAGHDVNAGSYRVVSLISANLAVYDNLAVCSCDNDAFVSIAIESDLALASDDRSSACHVVDTCLTEVNQIRLRTLYDLTIVVSVSAYEVDYMLRSVVVSILIRRSSEVLSDKSGFAIVLHAIYVIGNYIVFEFLNRSEREVVDKHCQSIE